MPLPQLPTVALDDLAHVRARLSRRPSEFGRVTRARELFGRFTDGDARAALEEVEKGRAERHLRRQRRGASGWRRGTPQCPSCRRILSGYNQVCPGCGFVPGYGHAR